MSNIGDLSVSITADVSEFTEPMQQVRDDIEQTVTVIHKQEAAWSQLAASAIPAIGQVTAAVASLAGTAMTIRHQQAMFGSIAKALSDYGLLAVRVAGMIVPQWRLITTAIGVAALAYKAATSDMIRGAVSSAASSDTLAGSISKIRQSASELVTAIKAPFEGLTSSIGSIAYEFLGVGEALAAAKSIALSFSSAVSSGLKSATKAVYEYGDTAATALAITQSWMTMSGEASAKFYEEAGSLRALAAASEAAIEKQQQQRSLFSDLRTMQEAAIRSAENAAEVARIGSLVTVEAVQKEVEALRERAASVILAGKADAEWMKQSEALFFALEKQRQGILNGSVVDKAAEEAKKKAEEARKKAADEAEAAARKQQEMTDRGIEQIARLKDQIDILNGSATQAEVAMREMTRQGFDAEQVVAVGALTDELERLKQEAEEAKKKGKKEPKAQQIDTSPEAAIKGSAQSFSAIFAASRRDTDERMAKASELATQELKKLNNQIGKLVNRDPVVVAGGEI